MQISFLPEIDRDLTKKGVEKALEEYQIMLLMNMEEIEPKVTASFQLAPSAPTNEFSSTTEDTAIKIIDREKRIRATITRIRTAVNKLDFHEKNIIKKRYFNQDDVYDYEVYNSLGYSESKYYRIKSDAFYKLGFMLRVVVYKEVNEE